VTATQTIEEIKRLNPEQQLGVIRFAYQLGAERQLTGNELASLAKSMVNTTDPAERARIREQIFRGFYGQRQHAWDPAAKRSAGVAESSARSNYRAPDFRQST
jgi:hypothetical protein